MQPRYRSMIGHGAIIIFIALICGFGLASTLIGGFEFIPGWIVEFDLFGNPEAWARAHVGGLLNGLFVIGVALSAHAMAVADNTGKHLAWMLIGTGYGNTLFYWGALFAPNRALTFADNVHGPANLASYIGLLPAFIFAFVAMVAMVMLARSAFARP